MILGTILLPLREGCSKHVQIILTLMIILIAITLPQDLYKDMLNIHWLEIKILLHPLVI